MQSAQELDHEIWKLKSNILLFTYTNQHVNNHKKDFYSFNNFTVKKKFEFKSKNRLTLRCNKN